MLDIFGWFIAFVLLCTLGLVTLLITILLCMVLACYVVYKLVRTVIDDEY